MAKGAGGSFFLEKGEKLGLGIGAGVGVLLVVLGVVALTSGGQDPADFAKAVEGKASQIKQKIDSKDALIPDLDSRVSQKVHTSPVALASTRENYFDPTQPPDGRRITPIVLTMVEGQADYA